MPRTVHRRTRLGAKLGACLAALAVLAALAACGSSDGGDARASGKQHGPKPAIEADVKALRASSCPAPYRVVHQNTYPRAQVREALENRFHIHHHVNHLVAPVDWKQDPYHSKAWSSVFASLKWMDVLIYAYRHGNRRALAEARDLMVDWVEHNPRHHPTTEKSWFNKVIGDRAPFIAYITRAASCEDMLSDEQAAVLVGSIADHGRALTSKKVYSPSNHGLFMDYGLASLAREASYMPKAAEWRKLAPKRFEHTLLRRVYPEEGFWLENSSSYHLAARLLTQKFIDLLGRSVPRSLDRLGRRMNEVAGWLIEPDKRRVLLGDSNLKLTPPDIIPLAKRDDGLLWLPRSGISIVKRPEPDPSFFLFGATFHNGTHNQADALTVDLFANGQRVLTDSGLYDKDPDPFQEFSRSSYSHSVMTIDGKSFPLGAGKAYGSGLRAVGQGDGWYAMEGVNPLASLQGVAHSRLVLYKPGYALVVADFTRAKRKHTYRRYFQLGPKLEVSRDGGSQRLTGPDGFVAELSSSGTAPSDLRLWNDHKDPLRGLIFPDYRHAVPRTTAQFTTHGKDVQQVATFALDRSALVRGSIWAGSSPGAATITLRGADGPRGIELIVTRSGGKLDVAASPG